MTKKLKRIVLLSAIALLTLLVGIAGFFMTEKSTTYADAVNGITFESGASFRASPNSSGIRFKAKIDETTSATLFSYDGSGNLTGYKNANYNVGMIIAPVDAFEIPSNNTYYSSKDYLNYLIDETNGLGKTKADIAVDFTFANNNFALDKEDGSVMVKGALVELQNSNLNYNYKAVVYYTLDNGTTYNYSGFSDETMLYELADTLLSGDTSEIDPDVVEDIYGMVANTIAMRDTGSSASYNQNTKTYSVTVNNFELLMNRELNVTSMVKSADVDYSFTNKTGAVTLSNGKLKATGVCSGTLNLSSYEGKIQYTYNCVNEPILSIITQGVSGAETAYKVVDDFNYSDSLVNRVVADSSSGMTLVGLLNQALYVTKGWGAGNINLGSGKDNKYWGVNIFNKRTSPSTFNSSDKYIVMGNCAYSRLAGLSDYVGKTENDYRISVVGNSIFVQGDKSAMRFALYQLLYEMIGYERIALNTTGIEAEIKVNDKTEAVLGKSELEYQSDLDIPYNFGFSSGSVYSQAYGAKVYRNASMGYAFGAELGSGTNYNDDGSGDYDYKIRGIHNSLGYFPYARYSTTHPEWYSQKSDGNGGYVINTILRENNVDVKVTDATQLCYYGLYNSTNDEAVDIAMNVVKQYTSTNAISFSNMDNGGFCQCANCKKTDYSAGGDACYWYLKFMNKLAVAMQEDEDTDHMKLKILIYGNIINQAPLDSNNNPNVTLENNIMIEFAYNYGDFYAGMSEIDRTLLNKWSKFTTDAGLLFWLYCTKTSYSMFFFDDFTNMQSKYQYLYSIGAQYIEDEGSKSSAANTNFGNLRVYLESKVTADVDCDYDGLTQNFFDSYFGVASSKMMDVFNKQKTLQQTAYANWTGENGLWHQGYDLAPSDKVKSSATTNSTGNNMLGTYSSNTFHYYINNSFHGNRYLLSLIQPKSDIEYMLRKINSAISTIAVSNLTTARKEALVSRILLEEIALIYQYCFIYDDNFATTNDSYQKAQGTTKTASPQVLSQSDLQTYLGCDSMDEVKVMFYQLAKYFGFGAINYKPLTTNSSINSIYTTWGLSGTDADTDNSTWYAQYMAELLNPTQYTISYVLNGGTNNVDNPVAYAANTEEVTILNPTRDYYTFAGWAEGNKILEGSTGNKTFTATWTPIEYNIIYNLNGGTNNINNPSTYNIEDSVTLLAPSKEGFSFDAWTEGDTISLGSTGEKTFTATWTAIEYDITYVLNGGTNNANNPSFYQTTMDTITLLDPSRAGYTFAGWTEGNTITAGSTGEKTFTATWNTITYTISYVLNGGINNINNPATYTVESGKITLLAPTKDGYIFKSWSDNGVIKAGSTGDKTFTATWYSSFDSKGIEYEIVSGKYYVKSVGTFTGSTLVIPEKLNGIEVVGISANAFKDNTTITEITLSANIVNIGANAFSNFTNSLKITFQGTTTAWNAITKGTNWNDGTTTTYFYTIGNNDGKISDGGAWDWNYGNNFVEK